MKTWTYLVHKHMCVYLYIYIYVERERENCTALELERFASLIVVLQGAGFLG